MEKAVPGQKEIIEINDQGQIILPPQLLELWNLSEGSKILQLEILNDGCIKIQPIDPKTNIPYSYKVEINKELQKMVIEALKAKDSGKTVSKEEFLKFLKDEIDKADTKE